MSLDPTRWLLLAQAAATLAMIGAIWIVQVVHYPLFAAVGAAGFPAYAEAHARLITFVVGPLMLVEATTAALSVGVPDPAMPAPGRWLGLALVAVIWASTAVLQVPQHQRLAAGFDAGAHAFLVRTNWIRTAAWTARGVLILVWLGRALR